MRARARTLSIGRPPVWLAAGLGVLLVLSEATLGAQMTAEARSDIHYIWRDGVRLANGENPYAYDHLPEPDERPTSHPSYLPLFYLAVAGAHHLGVQESATCEFRKTLETGSALLRPRGQGMERTRWFV
jgi:hypothetical protein